MFFAAGGEQEGAEENDLEGPEVLRFVVEDGLLGHLGAAAEGAVEGDVVDGELAGAGGGAVFAVEDGALGIEDVLEVDEAFGVVVYDERGRFLGRSDGLVEELVAAFFVFDGGEGGLDLSDSLEDGFFVVGECLAGAGFLNLDRLADSAAFEDAPLEGGTERIGAGVGVDEVAGAGGLKGEGAGEAEFRIEFRLGDADGSGLRGEGSFGGTDVGAGAEEVGGQTDGEALSRGGDFCAATEHASDAAGVATDEDGEIVEGGGEAALKLGNECLGGREVGFGLTDVDLWSESGRLAVFGDLHRFFLCGNVGLSEGDASLEGAVADVV